MSPSSTKRLLFQSKIIQTFNESRRLLVEFCPLFFSQQSTAVQWNIVEPWFYILRFFALPAEASALVCDLRRHQESCFGVIRLKIANYLPARCQCHRLSALQQNPEQPKSAAKSQHALFKFQSRVEEVLPIDPVDKLKKWLVTPFAMSAHFDSRLMGVLLKIVLLQRRPWHGSDVSVTQLIPIEPPPPTADKIESLNHRRCPMYVQSCTGPIVHPNCTLHNGR